MKHNFTNGKIGRNNGWNEHIFNKKLGNIKYKESVTPGHFITDSI